jgi:hypothetical protein
MFLKCIYIYTDIYSIIKTFKFVLKSIYLLTSDKTQVLELVYRWRKKMTNEENFNACKNYVATDVRINQKLSGNDYSRELGTVLLGYLAAPGFGESYIDSALASTIVLGGLEDKLKNESGKTVFFPEMRKCAMLIARMLNQGDSQGIESLGEFALNLVMGGSLE